MNRFINTCLKYRYFFLLISGVLLIIVCSTEFATNNLEFSVNDNNITQTDWYKHICAIQTETEESIEGEYYTIVRNERAEEDSIIAYPQITSSNIDQGILEKINDILYSYLADRVSAITTESSNPNINVEYRIFRKDDVLSICYEGNIFDCGSSHNFAFSLNLDMNTGKQYSIGDFCNPDEVFEMITQRELFPLSRLGSDSRFWSDENYYNYGVWFLAMTDYDNAFFVGEDYIGIILPVSRPMGDYIFLVSQRAEKQEDGGTVLLSDPS